MPDRLEDLHRRIDDLTDPDGDFSVVCPLSGKRPVPVKGKSFPSADAAEDAVDLVREYRTVLREVDPHLECLPIAAVEETAEPLRLTFTAERRGRASRERSGDARGSDWRASGRRASGWRTPDRRSSREESSEVSNGCAPGERGHPDGNRRQPSRSFTLAGDGEGEWLRMDDAPVVTVREDGEPLSDVTVGHQLNAKL